MYKEVNYLSADINASVMLEFHEEKTPSHEAILNDINYRMVQILNDILKTSSYKGFWTFEVEISE